MRSRRLLILGLAAFFGSQGCTEPATPPAETAPAPAPATTTKAPGGRRSRPTKTPLNAASPPKASPSSSTDVRSDL